MPDELNIDLETFSLVDIKRGLDRYVDGVEILLFAYALNDAPVQVWDVTADPDMPLDLMAYLADQSLRIVAHNASFEAKVLATHKYGIDPLRWRCTMAQAFAHGLPGGLDKLCELFAVDDDKAKLKDGKALVRLFCCPRPKNVKLRRATRHTHPAEWARFVEYCGNDVAAMREVKKKLPAWNYGDVGEVAIRERDLWHLDQRINLRGVPIDTALVHGAIETAERAKRALAAEASDITFGAIEATTQRNALLSMLNGIYSLGLDDLRGATIERLLKSDIDLPAEVVDLLNNRLAASSTSVAKYQAFDKRTGADGRLRHTIQFCGASRTGRDAGRGVQPQNFPRQTMKHALIESGIASIKAGCAALLFDNPMELLSSAIRGCIAAPAGRKLAVADLSNIEGRMLAFLAGEQWKLDAFAEFDTCLGEDGNWHSGNEIRDAVLAGRPLALKLDRKGEPTRKGPDLYALAYAKAFGVTPEAVMENKASGDGSWRQIGKVMELALGYEGGVGAFATFALAYGIDLDVMAANAMPHLPPAVWLETARAWEWANTQNRTYGMAENTWRVCDTFKRLWRNAHPNTFSFWKALERAFRNAILTPGTVFNANAVRVRMQGSWVRVVLPSGRSLCYPSPKLDDEDKISYMGVNQFTRQWSRIKTYSGKLAENVTQAASRDVLKHPQHRIEAAGYDILIPIHDELITETPDDGAYTADHLAAMMADNPPWATGLPLAAAGFEAYRYRKD